MIQFSSVQFDLTQIPYIVIRSETEKAKNTRYNMETQKLHRDNNNNNNNPERSKKKKERLKKKKKKMELNQKGEQQQGSAKIA